MSEYSETPTKDTDNAMATTFEYIDTYQEKDGSMSVIARNPETGKIYKFMNCVPTGCRRTCSSSKVDTIDFEFNAQQLKDLPDSPITYMLKIWLDQIGVGMEGFNV